MWPEEPKTESTTPQHAKTRQVMRAEIRKAVEREERIHWPNRKRQHCFQTVAVREIDKGIWWRRVLTPEQLAWCKGWVKRSMRRWPTPVEL